jgi:hypothetical protein
MLCQVALQQNFLLIAKPQEKTGMLIGILISAQQSWARK